MLRRGRRRPKPIQLFQSGVHTLLFLAGIVQISLPHRTSVDFKGAIRKGVVLYDDIKIGTIGLTANDLKESGSRQTVVTNNEAPQYVANNGRIRRKVSVLCFRLSVIPIPSRR